MKDDDLIKTVETILKIYIFEVSKKCFKEAGIKLEPELEKNLFLTIMNQRLIKNEKG